MYVKICDDVCVDIRNVIVADMPEALVEMLQHGGGCFMWLLQVVGQLLVVWILDERLFS